MDKSAILKSSEKILSPSLIFFLYYEKFFELNLSYYDFISCLKI